MSLRTLLVSNPKFEAKLRMTNFEQQATRKEVPIQPDQVIQVVLIVFK